MARPIATLAEQGEVVPNSHLLCSPGAVAPEAKPGSTAFPGDGAFDIGGIPLELGLMCLASQHSSLAAKAAISSADPNGRQSGGVFG